MNEAIIRLKAKKIFKIVSKERQTSGVFRASAGWFGKFRDRRGIRAVKKTGESASVDLQLVAKGVKDFEEVASGYLPEQVFNVDETGLFWKQRRGRTYTTQNRPVVAGEKLDKKRVTILLGKETIT